MTSAALSTEDRIRIQRRTVGVLSLGQVLGGVAFGATVSLGALLAKDISGSDALSGLATASVTLGAAVAAIPLARLAGIRGRRFALTAGNLLALIGIGIVISAAAVRSFPLLLTGIVLIGMGNAGSLQSRFAATDLADPAHRGRDLSIVVWATTIGGVAGPLLLGAGEQVGHAIGMPVHTGSYLFSLVAQIAAFALYLLALRPDPLLVAREFTETGSGGATVDRADRPVAARYAMFAIAGSHVTMASVMAMTPVHLVNMAMAGMHHGSGSMGSMDAGGVSEVDVTVLVGVTIALHVAGMYALSPLFGILADRWGRLRTVLLGQALLVGSLCFAMFAGETPWGVMVALVLLGLGWSAATVAGAALLTEASAPALRTRRQGRSDSLMSLSAAGGAVLAGVILQNFSYAGLAIAAFIVVAAIVVLSPFGKR